MLIRVSTLAAYILCVNRSKALRGVSPLNLYNLEILKIARLIDLIDLFRRFFGMRNNNDSVDFSHFFLWFWAPHGQGSCRSSLHVKELLEAPKQIGSFYELLKKGSSQIKLLRNFWKIPKLLKKLPTKRDCFVPAPKLSEWINAGYGFPNSLEWNMCNYDVLYS